VGEGATAGSRPRIAVLTEQWDHGDPESRRVLRQMGGALALRADVTIVSTGGPEPGRRGDGAFEVVRMASRPEAVALRRALVTAVWTRPDELPSPWSPAVAGVGRAHSEATPTDAADASTAGGVRGWLTGVDRQAWQPAAAVLRALAPEVVVVAGLGGTGLLDVLEASRPDATVVHIPLLTTPSALAVPDATTVLRRADVVLVATPFEAAALVAPGPDQDRARRKGPEAGPVVVGLPVPIHDGARREPVPALGREPYLAVIGVSSPGGPADAVTAELRLLTARFPDRRVVGVFRDRAELWWQGRCYPLAPLSGEVDLGRLMAWARAAVDLRPGPLVAFRTLLSLRYGTPVVAPEGSTAHHHLGSGRAGLWYRDRAELAAATEMILDESLSERLGTNGLEYVQKDFADTDRFVARVHSALGW
jgi:hypothetical protein